MRFARASRGRTIDGSPSGTSGSDCSLDDVVRCKPLDRENYNSVGFTAAGEGWAVGRKGRVVKFVR